MNSRLHRPVILILTLLLSPLLALLVLALLTLNLMDRCLQKAKRTEAEKGPPLSGIASIVILNWNGLDLLRQGLPALLAAVERDGRDHEIILADNGSTDGSVDYVTKEFPGIRVLSLAENLGFARANNAAVRAASHDVVVLLNNDMVVDPGFLPPLLTGFGPDTFAVSSQIFAQRPGSTREETGRTSATFRRGMIDFTHRKIPDRKPRRPYYPVFWAGGGSSAFHRERFLRLGGFHEIYSPVYVEDVDLSFRAWREGWEVLLAPESVVYHKHRATTSRLFSAAELNALVVRNQTLFIWKNFSSWRLWLAHAAFLPWNVYRLGRDLGRAGWAGLLSAVLRLPAVAVARLREPCSGRRSDREIFLLLSMPSLFFARRSRRVANEAQGAWRTDENRPRLLWVTAYLPHLGRHGGAARMFHLLRRMSSRYRITLLSFLEGEDEEQFLPEVQGFCERVEALHRIPPSRLQLFAYEPFDEFRTPQMEAAVQACLEDGPFDLIQLEYTQMACYGHRELGIPILLTKPEVDFAACARRARTERNPLLKARWFYNYLQVLQRETSLLKRVDAAICVTDADKHELEKFSRSVPIHVVNSGVDLEYFRPPEQAADSSRIVFVGAFQHYPNVDSVLYFCRDILPRIRSQVPPVELLIVGSQPPVEVADLARIPGVTVTGSVPDIRPFMAESSVCAVPLRLGVGMRGKVLEAWAMAMPVVATSVAAAGLRVEDGRNILIADDAECFARRVVSLLEDPGLRLRLGMEGRATAERWYGWEAAAAELDRIYRMSFHGPAASQSWDSS